MQTKQIHDAALGASRSCAASHRPATGSAESVVVDFAA